MKPSHDLDLDLVPVFLEVVRRGSFSAAARRLGLPRSSVSRQVARLEEQVGARLLARTTRSLRLTEDGEAFFARVGPAVETVREAVHLLRAAHGEPRGNVRMTVPPDPFGLTPVLLRFLDAYPGVTVELHVTARRVDLVREGFDLAIRAGRLQDSALIARRLVRVHFELFAARTYLEAHGEPCNVHDLAEHRWVVLRPEGGAVRWRLNGPADTSFTVEPRGRLVTNDLPSLARAVRAGEGLGLAPRGVFGPDLGDVRRVLPEWSAPGGDVFVAYPATGELPARVRVLRDFLLREFSQTLRTSSGPTALDAR